MSAPVVEFDAGFGLGSVDEVEVAPGPAVTAAGKPRTPSTPGRKPGQRASTTAKAPPPPPPPRGSTPGASKPPPAPKAPAARVNRKPAVEKTIRKIGGSLLIAAKTKNQPALAADAIALLQVKDELAAAFDELAADTRWLAAVIDKVAVLAPGVEAGAILVGLGIQVGVNHSLIPLDMGILFDAKDPRELLTGAGIKLTKVDEPVGE